MPDTSLPLVHYSVVVPFYNEAGNVADLLDEIAHVMRELGEFEILAIDDGSCDDTATRLAAAAQRVSCVRPVRHARNRGQSASLVSGIEAARGECVITLDGDGQNDPADIPRLVAEFHASGRSHLICGYRRQRQDTVLRRLSSRIANAVRSRLLGDATPDTGCGLKVMPRDLFMRLPRFDHMHRFLPALALREGARVTSVVVSHRARRFGRSSYGVWNRLWVGVVDLFGVMWLKRRAFRAAVSEEMNDGC